jgi:hypothetical protein
MKEAEIKKIVEQAIEPLKTQIADLEAQFAPLLAMVPKPQQLPAPVKEAQEVLKTIPQETLAALKVVNVGFDETQPCFVLVRADGSRISIKKNQFDFRLRVRDQNGALLKEMTPSINGLVSTLKSLA